MNGVGTDIKYVAKTFPKEAGNALADPKNGHTAYADLARPDNPILQEHPGACDT